MTTELDIPYLDISDPSFAMHSHAVREARARSWVAKTNYGYAIRRHEYVSKLLKDPRLRQGSAKWPENNGVHSGLFYDWWTKCLLVLEGQDQHRTRPLREPRIFAHK